MVPLCGMSFCELFLTSTNATAEIVSFMLTLKLRNQHKLSTVRYQLAQLTQVKWLSYSMPWAKIMTRPGSIMTSSIICRLSQLSTSTACLPVNKFIYFKLIQGTAATCLPGMRRHTQLSQILRLVCRVSSELRPLGQRRSWQNSIRLSRMCGGQPDSDKARLIMSWGIGRVT